MKPILIKSPLHRRLYKLPKAIAKGWRLNKGIPLISKLKWALFVIKITLRK